MPKTTDTHHNYWLNAAVTEVLFSTRTVQTELPAPLVELQLVQLAKVEPARGAAVSVTVVPATNWSLQDDGDVQLMPEPVTVPMPRPEKLTVRIGSLPGEVQPEPVPSTVTGAELLTTSLFPSWSVAKMLASPQPRFGETIPAGVT